MAVWDLLAENRRPRKYCAGQLLYLQGTLPECFYYLISGSVRSFISTSSGEERVLTIHRPGDPGHAVLFRRLSPSHLRHDIGGLSGFDGEPGAAGQRLPAAPGVSPAYAPIPGPDGADAVRPCGSCLPARPAAGGPVAAKSTRIRKRRYPFYP